ncbi:hydrogenase maturation nickel metallochaperone HypA [Thermosulfurimonas sp.]|uniref:hydrogenase maturation nickel metallochaperone HypA/HybF n=1 Tax=Thermosulfurimonas sp. TaxID=2080236 RepID=UPI0025CC2832|nr:hydrogenase maturation nickel metallochaperone HypA [Thermosulfurimonas sp.]
MHEASLVAALAEELLRLKEHEGAHRVLRFTVEIGELSGVDPEAFRWAYEVLREMYAELKEAEMILDLIPARFRCETCGREFSGDYFSLCPGCQSPEKTLLSGEELTLREVEFEVADV